MTREQWKEAQRSARIEAQRNRLMDDLNATNPNPTYGQANFTDSAPFTTWTLVPKGAGAHLYERHNIEGRSDLSVFDTKDTPRFYPYGDKYNAGMAHVLMHRATEAAGIERRGRNDGLSTSELTSLYTQAYSDPMLDGIYGELRTPKGTVFLGGALTPAEAFERLTRWGGNG